MRIQRYFPSRIADQVLWLQNFAGKLPQYQQALALSDEELAATVADARFVAYVLGSWLSAVRAFADATTASVEQVLYGTGTHGLPSFTAPALPDGVPVVADGALERVFRCAKLIKYRSGFTPAIATDLGLTPSNNTPDRPQPRFSLKIERLAAGPAVQVSFFKYRHTGIWIESRRGGGEPEPLGIATSTPWLDERPLLLPGQPEMREYRLRFWDDGSPNGEWTRWEQIAVPA